MSTTYEILLALGIGIAAAVLIVISIVENSDLDDDGPSAPGGPA